MLPPLGCGCRCPPVCALLGGLSLPLTGHGITATPLIIVRWRRRSAAVLSIDKLSSFSLFVSFCLIYRRIEMAQNVGAFPVGRFQPPRYNNNAGGAWRGKAAGNNFNQHPEEKRHIEQGQLLHVPPQVQMNIVSNGPQRLDRGGGQQGAIFYNQAQQVQGNRIVGDAGPQPLQGYGAQQQIDLPLRQNNNQLRMPVQQGYYQQPGAYNMANNPSQYDNAPLRPIQASGLQQPGAQ